MSKCIHYTCILLHSVIYSTCYRLTISKYHIKLLASFYYQIVFHLQQADEANQLIKEQEDFEKQQEIDARKAEEKKQLAEEEEERRKVSRVLPRNWAVVGCLGIQNVKFLYHRHVFVLKILKFSIF